MYIYIFIQIYIHICIYRVIRPSPMRQCRSRAGGPLRGRMHPGDGIRVGTHAHGVGTNGPTYGTGMIPGRAMLGRISRLRKMKARVRRLIMMIMMRKPAERMPSYAEDTRWIS